MKIDIYEVTPSGDIYLGFKYFETRPIYGDIISFFGHEYKVLEAIYNYIYVKLIN